MKPIATGGVRSLNVRGKLRLHAYSIRVLVQRFNGINALCCSFTHKMSLHPMRTVHVHGSVNYRQALRGSVSLRSSIVVRLCRITIRLMRELRQGRFEKGALALGVGFRSFDRVAHDVARIGRLVGLSGVLPLTGRLLGRISCRRRPVQLVKLSISGPGSRVRRRRKI